MKVRVQHYPHPQGWDEGFYALINVATGAIAYSVTPPGQHVGHYKVDWSVRGWSSDRLLSASEPVHQTAVRIVSRHRAKNPFTPTVRDLEVRA